MTQTAAIGHRVVAPVRFHVKRTVRIKEQQSMRQAERKGQAPTLRKTWRLETPEDRTGMPSAGLRQGAFLPMRAVNHDPAATSLDGDDTNSRRELASAGKDLWPQLRRDVMPG
jgi:hypothetical protein